MANFLMVDGYNGPSKNPQYLNSFEVLGYGFDPGNSPKRYGAVPSHEERGVHFFLTNLRANLILATANRDLLIKKIILAVTKPGEGSAKASEYLRMTLTDSIITDISISPEAFSIGIYFSNRQIEYGVVPPLHESVQPKHRHMIQLSKGVGKVGLSSVGR